MSGRKAAGASRIAVAAAAASVLIGSAASAEPSPQGESEGLPNFDRRDLDPAAVRPADTGRLLTGRSGDPPVEIALDYVRTHGEAFGLRPSDVANLVLVARDVSPDGITHLRFNQILDGIESFDSGIDAHITSDGRLITMNGSGVPGADLPSAQPQLGALEGLAEAREATGGPENLPRKDEVEPGPSRETSFTSGEHTELRWSDGSDGPTLVWQAFSEGNDSSYEVLVDADDGDVLRRQDLTSEVGQIKYFPRDPDSTPVPTQFAMPTAWYSDHAGGTRLWGQYARTYADPGNVDPGAGSEQSGTTQIPASSGAPSLPNWVYTQSHDFPDATPCPTSGCTWDSNTPATSSTNMFQAGANAHALVNHFAEYLAQPPIGFDEASGNYQLNNSSGQGLGNDYVRVELINGSDLNNAVFTAAPDGQAPRLQLFLYTIRDVNSADEASTVYHEYTHGLNTRLVVTASGSSALFSLQGGMMNEGWADFYGIDLLVGEGWQTDTPGVADVVDGPYSHGPTGARSKPIDCPVNPAGETGCNSTVPGGYTYGDLVVAPGVHHGGEVWAQTLWDIRKALGRQATMALVTGGMRLTPDNPSMLDARDAILQQAIAARSAVDAPDDHYAELWTIFAARGMGAGASTPSASSTTPTEAFDLPSGGLSAIGTPVVRDPYPQGDDDGMIEPGERFVVEQAAQDIGLDDLSGVTGTLSADDPAVIIEDGTAAWPLLGKARIETNSDELAGRLPLGSCSTNPELTVEVTSSEGDDTASTELDLRPTTNSIVPIPDPGTVDANWSLQSGGAITDVNLRIDELRHTFLGNLQIRLIHDGVTVLITSGFGGSGDDIVDAVFDDEAAGIPGSTPVTGHFRAIGTPPGLAAFDGHPAAGLWTLRITDTTAGNAGQLRQWGLDGPQIPCNRVEIPAASTGVADGLTDTSANLKGTVTPNGRATGIRFSYGTTSAYGASTPVTDVGSGDGAVAGLRKVAGLQPGTVYHYRAEAMREGEVAIVGQDRTFTTPAVTPRLTGVKVKLRKAGAGKRATFRFSLSEAATVTVSLRRGRRPIGKAARAFARAGAATLPFAKKLKRGRYSATLIATDLVKNASKPTRVRFRVG